MNKNNQKVLLWVAVLFLLALLSRFVPHAPGWTAVGAFGFFAGVLLTPIWAVVAVMALVAVSDLFLGFHLTQIFVMLGFAVMALGGHWAQRLNANAWLGQVALLLASSLGFFAVSNLGVWLVGGLYPLTMQGLQHCFLMAIPFLRDQLFADLTFGLAFAVATRLVLGFELRRSFAKD